MRRMDLELPVPDGRPAGVDYGGSGQPVLLVHGTGHNAMAGADVAARLTGHCHPVAIECRYPGWADECALIFRTRKCPGAGGAQRAASSSVAAVEP
jgi:hypothetical protein